MTLDARLAERLASIALGHVAREYPHLLGHVLYGDADVLPPRALHPVFFGSFDWHSCVHGWWTLLTLRRLFPQLPQAEAIATLADATFTEAKIAGELAYLERPGAATFERPYGWAWLLTLHHEAVRHRDRDWGERLEPLARAFAAAFPRYLGLLTYPIRAGTHGNSAFAVAQALPWAERFDAPLAASLRARAWAWYAADRDCRAGEPDGDAFLSPSLIEALCMARCLPSGETTAWLARFLPQLADREPAALFAPAVVSARSDGKIAHLDGFNLSRAWCWRGLAPHLPPTLHAAALAAAEAHLAVALPHLADAYAGEHWLASFALLAMLADEGAGAP